MDATTFIILWIVSGLIGAAIGCTKGRPFLGGVLGFCLGIFGLLIIAIVPKTIEKKAEEQAKIRAILGDRK